MKIHKLINNNIVVTINEQGDEIIMMGRGIGYKKNPGDEFDSADVEKIFMLTETEKNHQLLQLLNEIPVAITNVSMNIMEYAIEKTNKKLNESIIISLSDHIFTSVERSKKDIYVKNMLLWEIKKFYPEEYSIGEYSLNLIMEEMGVLLPEDEAGFIALHIVNAQLEETMDQLVDLTKVMQEIMNIIKYTCHIAFDEESIYYYRFITHLKFFAQRLITKTIYQNEEENALLDIVKQQYLEAFSCVNKITDFIAHNYDYSLSKEEQLYLTIHIERIIKKSK